MTRSLLLLSLLLSLWCFILCENASSKKADEVFMCYVLSWSVFRPGVGKFVMDDINPFLCTHIIYIYSSIDEFYTITSLDKWADFRPGEDNIRKLVNLKKDNEMLKILLGLGGWNEGSKKFSDLAKSEGRRKVFISSTIKYLKKYNLDGIDFDWQYPTDRGGAPEDKDNFPTLLEDMRKVFDEENKILTVRLVRYIADKAYDIPRISAAVHYINLKTYDYHGLWEDRTGVYAPLYSQDQDNVESNVDYMIEKGADRSKLLLGLSSGGNAFVLESEPEDELYLGVKTTGSFHGLFLRQEGFLGFNELCWEFAHNSKWKLRWDKRSLTPYAFNGKNFSSFENPNSIDQKLRLISSRKLGGANLFTLDTDDFQGHCYSRPYPLAKTIKELIDRHNNPNNNKPVSVALSHVVVNTNF